MGPNPTPARRELRLSEAMEDALKAIHKLGGAQHRVAPSQLVQALGCAPATVTHLLRRLAELRLVEYTPYQGVRLTPPGERIALEIVRHHRLLELYLAEALGMPWDQVHDEADRLEHVISEALEARIAERLGHPRHDPHGDPIPTPEGTGMVTGPLVSLAEAPPGTRGLIKRVSDEDAGILAYLGELGFRPGREVRVLDRAPFDGPITVRLGEAHHALGEAVASRVFLLPLPEDVRRFQALDRLAPGQEGIVVDVRAADDRISRLLDLGFRLGVRVRREEGFRYTVEGRSVRLAREEARTIRVGVLEGPLEAEG